MLALKKCGNKKGGAEESFIVVGTRYLISYISNDDTNFQTVGNK